MLLPTSVFFKLNNYLKLNQFRTCKMRFFWPARRNIIGTSHDRSTDSHTFPPRPMTVAQYKITQHVPERQRPMSLRSAQQRVSCFGRTYSHLEVLTQGISSGNRSVFTNTPNADIVMCIIIYEYTARCIHIELCRYFIILCNLTLIQESPTYRPPLAIGYPDYMATFSLQ